MINIIQLLAVMAAGLSVGIADALIKKAALDNSFFSAIKDPRMFFILFLYLIQIIFFIYVFSKGWKLGVAGVMQIVAYSAFVIFAGVFLFKESFSLVQYAGLALAVLGAILINC